MAEPTSSLVIEEQTGKKRKLELRGAALPFKGAAWGAKLKLVTSYNPGNPEGTQHVLSPEEVPSSWEGEWNTTRLFAAPALATDTSQGLLNSQVVRADLLRDFFEDILRSGQLLQVTWAGAEDRRVVRLGRASEWNFPHAMFDDIRWSVTFEWISRGAPQNRVAAFQQDNMLALTRQMVVETSRVAGQLFAGQFNADNPQTRAADLPTQFSLGQLEAIANAPLDLVNSFGRAANGITNRLKQIGNLVVTVRDLPSAVAGSMLNVANNFVAVANQFLDEMGRAPPESQINSQRVSDLTRGTTQLGKVASGAERAASVAVLLSFAAEKRRSALLQNQSGQTRGSGSTAVADDMLTVHIPKQGETMDSIALKFYQEELGDVLARANGLPGHTITPPRMPLIIPTKAVLKRQQQRTV